jgi:hypothetical protein
MPSQSKNAQDIFNGQLPNLRLSIKVILLPLVNRNCVGNQGVRRLFEANLR